MSQRSYIRFRSSGPLVYSETSPNGDEDLLIFDAVGEIGASELLSIRLRQIPEPLRTPGIIVFRGLSAYHRSNISDDFVREMFPNGSAIYDCVPDSESRLAPLLDTATPDSVAARVILDTVADLELRAILNWSEGVWVSPWYHFVLPSTEHADKFVRVGDACSDWLNVSRIADWLVHRLRPCSALVADTPTLLPLLQELEIRAIKRWPDAAVLKRALINYHPSREDLHEIVSECLLWVSSDNGEGTILVLVSVNASGGVLSRIQRAFTRDISDDDDIQYIVLCDTNTTSESYSLSTMPVSRHPKGDCGLCHSGSIPVDIDQQRFTTRILSGVEQHQLPKARKIVELSRMIPALDAANALRVHVTRPDHHSHLGIVIDVRSALLSAPFAQHAMEMFSTLVGSSLPDLAIIPAHKQKIAIEPWLAARGISRIIPVPLTGELPSDVVNELASASRILIADNSIITGNTMRALYQAVQTAKGTVTDDQYDVLGFAFVAYISDAGTWKGIRDCFYTGTYQLITAFEMFVPEWDFHCPWCVELRALEEIASTIPTRGADYVALRRERLSDPSGLTTQLYIGSELFEERQASRTTPKSFWGDVRDIGAFIGATTAFHEVRCAWSKKPQSLIMRSVFPTASILWRYRDPVLASSMLRTARPRELWAAETLQEVERALRDSQHSRQHPVLTAETLWAAYLQKLPPQLVIQALQERIPMLPESLKTLFSVLLDTPLE
jgi:hypothetical protein